MVDSERHSARIGDLRFPGRPAGYGCTGRNNGPLLGTTITGMGALSDVDPKSTGPRFILFTQADHARARALIGIEPPPADESLPLINRLPEEFDQQEALYQIAGKIDVSTASGLGELLGRGDSRKRGEAQLDWLFGRMGLEL